jgi:thiamine kinase-like enzyme
MIVWTFPHDPKLPHLPQIMAPERVKYYLPSALFPRGIEDPQELMVLAIESIRYCPADRCTLCCHLQWGSSSGPQRGLLFGKIFNDDRGREIYHQHALLWKKSLENPDGFLVAQPLEYSENAKLMWQQALPGIPLLHIINGINYTTFLAAVAKGLASLHASGLSSPVHIAIQDRLRQIRKRTSKMIQTFPVFQKAVHSIVDDLEHRAMYLTPMPEQLIHGDFHIKQLLVHKGKIGVCDYDDFAMGDPTQDLATFLVDLLFRDVDTRLIHLISIAFFHAYKAHVDWEIPVDRLQWQIHIEIIKKLYRLCFRKFQRRGFAEYIHQIITLVQQEINPETDLGTLASQVAKIRSMQS